MSVELTCYVKTIVFYKFYDFFRRLHPLMNRPSYNNLFQNMQHYSFQNLRMFWFLRCFLLIENSQSDNLMSLNTTLK